MNILIYCQHVLGIGHLVRTMEIARALRQHRVTLVLGGPPANIRIPPHVRVIQLPGLKMDADFAVLSPVDQGVSLAEVKERRAAALKGLIKEIRPDILLVELFPFGRNAFSFELLPVLEDIRRGDPPCRTVCSVRDILVEKKEQRKYEQRVIDRLNSYFDALLVHSDQQVVPLDATFSRMKDIRIPVVYTGFISRDSDPRQGSRLRRCLTGSSDEKLIVVSAGGGNVGLPLLRSAVQAFPLLPLPAAMAVFSGPYLADDDFARLLQKRQPRLWIKRFSSRFPAWLAAADLSISMGGYNTTMDILASSTRALIYPFARNREQMMRGELLTRPGSLEMLAEDELSPQRLAIKIAAMLGRNIDRPRINLAGARFTADWLSAWMEKT